MKANSSGTICSGLFICMAFPAMLYSCTAPKYVYSPATANLLEVENKNNIKVAVNYATTGSIVGNENRKSAGTDVQAAFAAGKRIVVRVDAYTKSEQNQTALKDNFNIPEEKNVYKKKGISVAAGIYNFSKAKNISMFQLNGGIGFGQTSFTSYDNTYGSRQNYFSADYIKFYLQPSIVIKASENYTGTIANTLSLMNYKSIRTDISDIKSKPLGFIGTKPSFFSEFTLQNEFGFTGLKGIRFQLQIGVSKLLTKFSSESPAQLYSDRYDYHKVWFAAGIAADLNKLFKK